MSITLTINGLQVTVALGTSVLEAARQAGFFIPTLCHDPEIPGFGACRICVVEIKGARALALPVLLKQPKAWLWKPSPRL